MEEGMTRDRRWREMSEWMVKRREERGVRRSDGFYVTG